MTTTTRRVAIVAVGFVVVVAALNLLARALDDAVGGNEPGGEAGSTFATASEGLAAYVELLARYDHRVERVNGDLAAATIDRDAVLVVVDPGPMPSDDVDVISTHLALGGRVVLAGASTTDARRFVTGAPALTSGTERYGRVSEQLGGIRIVTTSSEVAFDGPGTMTPLVGEGDLVLAAIAPAGSGTLVLLADSTPLSNGWIGKDDNAAFALELVGDDGARVVFAEGVHGYSSARGLDALPSGWKVGLLGVAAAALLFAWERARRLGPPDQPHRPLPPARAEYVDALAASLEHTREPAVALSELARATRARAERASIELDDTERAALTAPPAKTGDVLALGRTAARAARHEIEGRFGNDGRTTP